jgi:hypothetical protein
MPRDRNETSARAAREPQDGMDVTLGIGMRTGEQTVEPGTRDPDTIRLPGIFVHRVIQPRHEKRTLCKAGARSAGPPPCCPDRPDCPAGAHSPAPVR